MGPEQSLHKDDDGALDKCKRRWPELLNDPFALTTHQHAPGR